MLVGIDFDNTIVSYDNLFHKVAVEKSLVPEDIEPSKIKVRDYLRASDQEDIWTEMQGYVYGARMNEADAFAGVHEFLQWAIQNNIETAIISHKTKHPFIGEQYDLHAAAQNWIDNHLIDNGEPYIKQKNIYFELTKEDKIRRINQTECDFFIDDLPEILDSGLFPEKTGKILFDPVDNHIATHATTKVKCWDEILTLFQDDKWAKN